MTDLTKLIKSAEDFAKQGIFSDEAVELNKEILRFSEDVKHQGGAITRIARHYYDLGQLEEAFNWYSKITNSHPLICQNIASRCMKEYLVIKRRADLQKKLDNMSFQNVEECIYIIHNEKDLSEKQIKELLDKAISLIQKETDYFIVAHACKDYNNIETANKIYEKLEEKGTISVAANARYFRLFAMAERIYLKLLEKDRDNTYAQNGLLAVYYDANKNYAFEYAINCINNSNDISVFEKTILGLFGSLLCECNIPESLLDIIKKKGGEFIIKDYYNMLGEYNPKRDVLKKYI